MKRKTISKEAEAFIRIHAQMFPADWEILMERCVAGKTLQKIGDELGLTRERVRQREERALDLIDSVYNEVFDNKLIEIYEHNIRTIQRVEEDI